MAIETEIEVLKLKTRNGYQKQEESRQDPSLETSEAKHSPVQSLDFRFLVFITLRTNFCYFKPTNL